jgi:diacylglycerol kinase family enzyme
MANDPVEATGQMLASLRAGRIESVSLGNLNGRFFLFHAGLGYDAAVVAAVERHSTAKRYLGAAVFLGVAADVWARRFDRRTPWFAVETTDRDGRHSGTDGGFLAIALNTSPYTFLGERPLDVAPGTGFTTALSLLTVRSLGLPTLLRIIGAAWRGGPGGSDPFARQRAALLQRQLDRIEIRSERPLPYQLDGDYLGAIDRFVITSAPDALRLVLPPPPAPTDT